MNKEKPAKLSGPLAMTCGTLQFEFHLHQANRLSVRFHSVDHKRSFRVVVGNGRLEIKQGACNTLRITLTGDEITAQVGNVIAKGKNEVVAQAKRVFPLLVLDGEMGFRNLVVVKSDALAVELCS